MLPPLPRCSGWASSSLISPSRVSLPRFHVRIGLHIVLFEACLAFTRVAACTLARSPYVVTAIRRLQTFRLLHSCSGCFRLERLPGGPCTHWKTPPCHGAHRQQTRHCVVSGLGSREITARLLLGPAEMERRLAAILASDVVGYSRLMHIDEAGTLAALAQRRQQVLEPLVVKYHGRIVKV